MKNLLTACLALFLFVFSASGVPAAMVDLYDWGFNIDGTTYCLEGPCDFDVYSVGNITGPGDLPIFIDTTGFDFVTGLGSISITLSGPGLHSVVVFFDHDIDFDLNDTTNETGAAIGSPAPGQTWEIDEPGYGSAQNGSAGMPYFGDIFFDNFFLGTLDNQVFFDFFDNQTLTPPDEVSMALGWDVELVEGEIATVDLIGSDTAIPPGFHLMQSDPDSNASIFLSSSLNIAPADNTETDCFDGIDNDGDGLLDCVDFECEGVTAGACSTGELGICSTGTVTCQDGWEICVPDNLPSDCLENTETDCFDGIDNDGDGLLDCVDFECEGVTDGSCNTGEPGICAAGTITCQDGGKICVPDNLPEAEVCDNLDNNCDGSIDENLTRPTTCGVGDCAGNTGEETCTAGAWGNDTCDPLAGATVEICDGSDNDCDGVPDGSENLTQQCGNTDAGECSYGTESCDDSGNWVGCNAVLPTTEVCDGKDNDCDYDIDEGFDRDNDGIADCLDSCPDDPDNDQDDDGICGDVDIPGAADLVTPSGDNSDNMPTYTWSEVWNATWYYLVIQDVSGNVFKKWYSSTDAECDGVACSVTPQNPLPHGSSKWWLQTYNEYGKGPWSGPLTFTAGIGAATLMSPNGDNNDNIPTYTWNAVPNVTWYYLVIQDASGNVFKKWYSSTDAECDGVTCSATPQNPLPNGSAKWWLQTYNEYGRGPWSGPFTFTAGIGAATLISPEGSTEENTPPYTWNAVPSVTWYYLVIQDASGNVFKKWYSSTDAGCDGMTCSVTPENPLPHGSSKWWLQTYNEYGRGPWSGSLTFTAGIGAANLVSPSGDNNDNIPTYTWNAVPNVTWYYLVIQDASGNVFKKWYSSTDAGCDGMTCSVTPENPLPHGSAKWWLQTYNEYGRGPWSGPLTFTAGIGSATMISPDGSTGANTPTYTWDEMPYATWYYLVVQDASGNVFKKWYSSTDAGCDGVTCSVTPQNPLPNGSAKWWLQTYNEYGRGPWSGPLTFTIQ